MTARRAIPSDLLEWYDRNARRLPWRATPGAPPPEPYRVWLSEVMLQQTTTAHAAPYFASFTERWPTVGALAAAPEEEVMAAWAGLGYYSRARNLVACARSVTERGGFPESEEELRRLPGLGAYTAAAVAAIAFGKRAVVIDANVERVVARLFAIAEPLPGGKAAIRAAAEQITPVERAGDFAQAMMDLGATVCTPKRPRCMLCPLREDCRAILSGDPELLPVKGAKAEKPLRRGAAYVAIRDDGAILLRTRPERGLLGGMSEVPTTGWTARIDGDTGADSAPFPAEWLRAGSISHVFTHFSLELDVYRAEVGAVPTPDGWWWSPVTAGHDEALPTVMKKVIESAIPGATKRRH
jgi:A/G-specific adenine glycosylase